MMLGGRVRFTAAGRALKHRNFRFFFVGQLISVTGTWMQTLAQAWLMVTLVGPNQAIVYLGLLGAVQFLPVLVLGSNGEVAEDYAGELVRFLPRTAETKDLLALASQMLSQNGSKTS